MLVDCSNVLEVYDSFATNRFITADNTSLRVGGSATPSTGVVGERSTQDFLLLLQHQKRKPNTHVIVQETRSTLLAITFFVVLSSKPTSKGQLDFQNVTWPWLDG